MPRIVDHDQQRQELAQRSADLFASAGFNGLSMRTAAASLGVSTGTLYHYFPSKVALFRAVVHRVVQSDLAEAIVTVRALTSNRVERLHSLLRFVESHCERLTKDFRLVVEYAASEATAQEALDNVMSEMRQRYATAVRSALDIDDRRADIVALVINGLILRAMCGDTSTDIDATVSALAPLLAEVH